MKASAFALLLAAVGLPAAPADEPTDKEKKHVATVAGRLLMAMKPVEGLPWPPDVQVIADRKAVYPNNAYSNWEGDGKSRRPLIRVTVRYLRNLDGDADALAWVLGHELGHIHYKHDHVEVKGPRTAAFSQKREALADEFAAKLMKDARFSLVHGIRKFAHVTRGRARHNAPLNLLMSGHGAWNDRFARVVQHDKVWEALATFDNGVVLLAAQQYQAAERCFERVTRFDPLCHEAWVNLGHARLMQYCDKMRPEDLEALGIGQVVCGAFYRRAKSLEPPVRGKCKKLWNAAIADLTRAVKLTPDSALGQFNLGLAYLVHPADEPGPAGANQRRAEQNLRKARQALARDRSRDPLERVAVQVNLGVVLLRRGMRKDGLAELDKAHTVLARLPGTDGERTALGLAARYNKALALADDPARPAGKRLAEAARLFEEYLREGDPLSAWWPVAYKHYVRLCAALKQKPHDRKTLQERDNRRFRSPREVVLDGGRTRVALAEKTADVLPRLGKHRTIVLDDNLKRYRFQERGIDVLADDRVKVIFLVSDKAPPVVLRPIALGASKGVELRVGLTRKELYARALAGAVDRAPPDSICLETGADEMHEYYGWLGLAARFDGPGDDARVTELVIVPPPPGVAE
jgi:tetratricopeptide (TPR) repeat protein